MTDKKCEYCGKDKSVKMIKEGVYIGGVHMCSESMGLKPTDNPTMKKCEELYESLHETNLTAYSFKQAVIKALYEKEKRIEELETLLHNTNCIDKWKTLEMKETLVNALSEEVKRWCRKATDLESKLKEAEELLADAYGVLPRNLYKVDGSSNTKDKIYLYFKSGKSLKQALELKEKE